MPAKLIKAKVINPRFMAVRNNALSTSITALLPKRYAKYRVTMVMPTICPKTRIEAAMPDA